MKLDPRVIMQFVVIAEETSLRKASERLHVAQPWLSVRLRKLEEQLGFLLFVRNTRNVTLTDRGAELLEAARSVAASMNSAEALAERLKRQDDKKLRIGVPPYSNHILERRELIDRFIEEHRDIVVELEIGWSPSLLKRVRSGDLDVAFAMGPVKDRDFASIPLRTINIELLMSQDDPLARQNAVAVEQLAHRCVAVLSRASYPDLIDELCAPLIRAGTHLIQVPEISDNVVNRICSSERLIALWYHLADEPFSNKTVTWRPLDTSPKAPFSLIKSTGTVTPSSDVFWKMAARAFG